ncbi:MAG: glycosyltransferase [Flavobacteriales bacterium]|nr:glycosyltransferase [Flavobacteriales bacterium]
MLPEKCVIIGPAYPLRGGIAQLNESLSRQLTKMGVENVIYSFSLQYPDFLFPGKTQMEEGAHDLGTMRIRTTINSIAPWTWLSTARKILEEKPDIIIVRFWIPFMAPALSAICRYVKKRSDVRIVGLLDNVIPHEHRIGDRSLTKMFLNSCDHFAVMSSSVMADLSSYDRTKARKLLYHPVYDHFGESVPMAEARKRLGLSENDRVILFFGIVRHYKGLDLLLEAVAQMPDRTGLKVVVAGEFYEGKEECLEIIRKNGLEKHVILHDNFIPENEVKYYFCAANIMAQPYRSATQSGVTQIAYHFGTPMLVTDVGGLPEMVPHRTVGHVCPPQPSSIARHLNDFFSGNDEQTFRDNLPKEREKFSWSRFAKELLHW